MRYPIFTQRNDLSKDVYEQTELVDLYKDKYLELKRLFRSINKKSRLFRDIFDEASDNQRFLTPEELERYTQNANKIKQLTKFLAQFSTVIESQVPYIRGPLLRNVKKVLSVLEEMHRIAASL